MSDTTSAPNYLDPAHWERFNDLARRFEDVPMVILTGLTLRICRAYEAEDPEGMKSAITEFTQHMPLFLRRAEAIKDLEARALFKRYLSYITELLDTLEGML